MANSDSHNTEKNEPSSESRRAKADGAKSTSWTQGLDTIFSGLSALSAVAVVCLAFYGAFFTDLPERLVAQLRSDVTLAQEQAHEALNERQKVEGELEIIGEALANGRDRLASLQSETAALASEARRLRTNVRELRSDSDRYAQELREIGLERAFDQIQRDLEEIVRYGRSIENVFAFIRHLEREPDRHQRRFLWEEDVWTQRRAWLDERPDFYETGRHERLLWRIGNMQGEPPPSERRSAEDFISKLRSTRDVRDSRTGKSLIAEVFAREVVPMLHARHRQQFVVEYKRILAIGVPELRTSLTAVLDFQSEEKEFVTEGERIIANAQGVLRALPAIRESLLQHDGEQEN